MKKILFRYFIKFSCSDFSFNVGIFFLNYKTDYAIPFLLWKSLDNDLIYSRPIITHTNEFKIDSHVLSRVCLNESTKSGTGMTSIKLFSRTHTFVMIIEFAAGCPWNEETATEQPIYIRMPPKSCTDFDAHWKHSLRDSASDDKEITS